MAADLRLAELLKLSDLDGVARDARRLTLFRWTVVAIEAGLASLTISLSQVAVWLLWVTAAEACLWVSTRRQANGSHIGDADRLGYVSATVFNACGWLMLSVMFWQAPTQGAQVLAVLVWTVLLVNALTFAFRAPIALLILSAPVSIVLVAVPLIAPKFALPQQVSIVFGVVLLLLYAGVSARRDVRIGRELQRTMAELEIQRARAEAANTAKSAFLATMSHEIRTPLNGVIGMAQAMARDDLPSVQRERLGVIRQSGEALLGLLNDVLDLARIESGRFDLEDGVVDAEAIARSAQATFAALAVDKDIVFLLEVAPEAKGLWRGDPSRVRQILHNLIGNAVKFTDAGSVQVSVAHEGGRLTFAVTDTGPGIAPDKVDALFEKFVQVDASTTRRFGGSGLGLPICRELAALMGGAVSVTSVVGQGSTFTVALPLDRAGPLDQAAAPTEVEAAVLAGPDRTALRVLVAEDNAMNQLVIRTLLSQIGVEPRIVNDGAEAAAAFGEAAWDLILMDVQMPVMDGPTAARRIRGLEAAAGRGRTPIIALTANAMSHHHAAYLEAGMDLLVAKPIQVAQLFEAMDQALALAGDHTAVVAGEAA